MPVKCKNMLSSCLAISKILICLLKLCRWRSVVRVVQRQPRRNMSMSARPSSLSRSVHAYLQILLSHNGWQPVCKVFVFVKVRSSLSRGLRTYEGQSGPVLKAFVLIKFSNRDIFFLLKISKSCSARLSSSIRSVATCLKAYKAFFFLRSVIVCYQGQYHHFCKAFVSIKVSTSLMLFSSSRSVLASCEDLCCPHLGQKLFACNPFILVKVKTSMNGTRYLQRERTILPY